MSQSIFGPTYKDIIGDSFTVDDSGLEQPITVVVLMCLTFSDERKEAVDVPGSYTFSFKKSYIQVWRSESCIQRALQPSPPTNKTQVNNSPGAPILDSCLFKLDHRMS